MRIYIAAPFFNPQQLATVQSVELALAALGIDYYSPRLDGVLQEMSEEERKASLNKIFNLNVGNIDDSTALLAILDEKDTGTTWEMGYAFRKIPIYGYTSTPNVKLNVMLRQCMITHACGIDELNQMLAAVKAGKVWMAHQVGDTF